MSPDRREKIEALLGSPNAGEREAARTALDRLPDERPVYASPEWHAAIQEWCGKLSYCVSNMGSPLLSAPDIVLIRNWSKGRGEPWAPGADKVLAIYRKLKEAERAVALLPISLDEAFDIDGEADPAMDNRPDLNSSSSTGSASRANDER